MHKSLFKTGLLIALFGVPAVEASPPRPSPAVEAPDSVTCRLRHEQGHFIRAEYERPGLPLKVAIRWSGPPQNGFHGTYSLLTVAEARSRSEIMDSARREKIDLTRVDRVAVFALNGGFTIYKFKSGALEQGAVLNVLGSTYLCATEASSR